MGVVALGGGMDVLGNATNRARIEESGEWGRGGEGARRGEAHRLAY